VQWHQRLDTRLAAALMSIPAIKGVEIGDGFAAAARFGSEVHDAILPHAGGGGQALPRATNRAGGIEGGMSNGQDIVARAAMKPIATLQQPLASVDLATGRADAAGYERSDLCAVSAASVVAEAMVALVLADALLGRIGGETVAEFTSRLQAFRAASAAIGAGG
jgi:chorismate synthase